MLQNQENVYQPLKGSFANGKIGNPAMKNHPSKKKAGGSGAFNKLLSDATNQVREEEDNQLALEVQTNEATSIVMDWIREETDAKMAADMFAYSS